MIVFIYFMISFVAGFFPAKIAKKKGKNFILWWVYSTIFFPIALVHSILLLLNTEKGLFVLRFLLILYGIVLFYFFSWFISTQPAAMKWLKIAQNKYRLGSYLYTHTRDVAALQTTMIDYVAGRIGGDLEVIKDLFSTFEVEKQNNKPYLLEFCQSRLKEINSEFQNFILTEEEADQRNKIIETFIEIVEEIAATKFMTIQEYLALSVAVEREDIDEEFSYFEDSKHADKEYVRKYAINLIKGVSGAYLETIRKGAFDDWSVLMGEAAEVFKLYLKSLKDLNSYSKDQPLALESNYKSYLTTESTYFRTTTISEDYVSHLDKECALEIDNDRRQEIIDQYVYIGDRYIFTNQSKPAYMCYDKAIALYRDIIQNGEKSSKLKAEHLYLIGELYDKKHDLESVMGVYREFITVFFNERLYKEEEAHYDLEGFLKLSVITRNKQNFVIAVKEFTDFADQFETPEKVYIYAIENNIISTFFPKMPKEDRIPYAPIIQRNYNFLIAPKTLEIFPVIKQAFEFFNKYDFDEIAQTYIDYVETVVPVVNAKIDEVKNVISVNFLAETAELQEFAENIIIGKTPPDKQNRDTIQGVQIDIREKSKILIDTVIQIKEALAIIKSFLEFMNKDIDNKTLQINQVLSDVSRASKEYNDVVNDILKENEILTESFDKVFKQAKDAKEFAKEIAISPPFKRGENKEKLRTMRDEIKNEVNSLSAIIAAIVESKNNIGKKYNIVVSSDKLVGIKTSLISIKDEIDKLFDTIYPGELEEDKKETAKEDQQGEETGKEGTGDDGTQTDSEELPPVEDTDDGI